MYDNHQKIEVSSKARIRKKVYENHRLMISKLRNDIYQGLKASEEIIEEKVHNYFLYHFIIFCLLIIFNCNILIGSISFN